MTTELGKLGLEVQHEGSDTTTTFSRDGTVSWVHGLRFMTQDPNPSAVAHLCQEPRFHSFHPTMFRPSKNCSYYFSVWSQCWARECQSLWSSEHGCHHRETKQHKTACTSPFKFSILQVILRARYILRPAGLGLGQPFLPHPTTYNSGAPCPFKYAAP